MKVQNKKSKVQNNIIKLFFALIGVICVLIGRYGWVQIVQGEQMMARLKGQVQEESVLHVPRGTIYDANMKEMAISTMVSSLFVDPNHTENPQQVAADLAPIIGMSKEDAERKAIEALGLVHLENAKNRNPYDLDLHERKMVALASVIAMDTDAIILDEPTIAQDDSGKNRPAVCRHKPGRSCGSLLSAADGRF